jgi:hypothetical protein
VVNKKEAKKCHFCEESHNDDENVKSYDETYVNGILIEEAHPTCLSEMQDEFSDKNTLMNPNEEDDFHEQVNSSFE